MFSVLLKVIFVIPKTSKIEMAENQYTEDNIRSLDWKEHIRLRPGMYIGKLGDGAAADDGIYILVKEVVDNCIDEFVMGNGKRVDIKIKDGKVSVRDYGRGIPLGKVVEVVSKMNTGGKYDSKAFKKSVGLNGVGTKAVNALSSHFMLYSVRDGEKKEANFERGNLFNESTIEKTDELNGTYVEFIPDDIIFKKYAYKTAYLEKMIWNYCYLNRGLTIHFNGERFQSKDGLKDLLEENIADEFAIGFADWRVNDWVQDERWTKISDLKELLEIYKKEKGL